MVHYLIGCYPNYKMSAAYNRVRLVAEGLLKNGISVNVHYLIFKNRDLKILNILEIYLFSYIRHSIQLLQLLRTVGKKDVVIIYDVIDQYWILRYFGKKTNLVVELLEYPYYEINYEKYSWVKQSIQTFYNKQNLNYLKYASCVITCSSYLKNYYQKYNTDIYILPLVVDLEELITAKKNNKSKINGEYIAYCGSFINNKDGLPILIDSFKLFHNHYSHVKLVLIGSGPEATVNKIVETVRDKGLIDSVIFTGSLPHSEVLEWLSDATILALARPNNRQAEGGIPSKVGEYLASGVPCVITKTGDIPKYLQDGVDSFLCEADSVPAFAQRLEDCYKSNRSEIGRRAVEAAQQFCHVRQTKLFADYLAKRIGMDTLK